MSVYTLAGGQTCLISFSEHTIQHIGESVESVESVELRFLIEVKIKITFAWGKRGNCL